MTWSTKSLILALVTVAVLLVACGKDVVDPPTQVVAAQQTAGQAPGPVPEPQPDRKRAPRIDFFSCKWNTETHYIADQIIQDIAAMAEFARTGKAPADPANMGAVSEWYLENPIRFEYDFRSTPTARVHTIRLQDQPLLGPGAYVPFAMELLEGVSHTGSAPPAGTLAEFLAPFETLEMPPIVQANRELSTALTTDFMNSDLHTRAAILHGILALKERGCGYHQKIPSLCRMAAHLAIAQTTSPDRTVPTTDDLFAQALLDALTGRQVAAISMLDILEKRDPALAPWIRALRIRTTLDYRLLKDWSQARPMERYEAFRAESLAVGQGPAMRRHLDDLDSGLEVLRLLADQDATVEAGHMLNGGIVPLEIADWEKTFRTYHDKPIDEPAPMEEMNALPGGCIAPGSTPVQVVSWGHFANFHQRHLCGAIHENYQFLDSSLGIAEQSAAFRRSLPEDIKKLRNHPFLQHLMQETTLEYRSAVDAMLVITKASPQLVTIGMWYQFGWTFQKTDYYFPAGGNIWINEWMWVSPLPGTAENTGRRRVLFSMTMRPDLEELHQLAPLDPVINELIFRKRDAATLTMADVEKYYGESINYLGDWLEELSRTLYQNEDLAYAVLRRATQVDATNNSRLLGRFIHRLQPEEVTRISDELLRSRNDAVLISHVTEDMVLYFAQRNDMARAEKWAEFGHGVYSGVGLLGCAYYHEIAGELDKAAKDYNDLATRYDDTWHEAAFWRRRSIKSPGTLPGTMSARIREYFPVEPVAATLADFSGTPTTGVIVSEDTEVTKRLGLKKDDVIVGCNGFRVNDYSQYMAVRENNLPQPVAVIFWNGSSYREMTFNRPGRGIDVYLLNVAHNK